MKKIRYMIAGAIVLVFLLLDLWFGNTYHYMNIGSMIYLATVIITLVGVLFVDKNNVKSFFGLFGVVVGAFALFFTVGGLMSVPMFNASRYAEVIGDVKQVEFADLYSSDHVVEMSYADKQSSIEAAQKKIGELEDLSSTYELNQQEFSQVNYKGKMVRVAPFQYTDTLKKYLNFSKGVPYYIVVQTANESLNASAEIVTLEEPMKYYPGAPLQYDLHRHVAINHKFSYLDDWYFEIDEQGHPYWIVQSITKRVGIWGAKDMSGIIVVDAVTGETKKYNVDEAPEWIDTVYPTDMLMAQANHHYTLGGGYWNSIFQQKGVMKIDSEEGNYNYVSIDDEIYIFAGIRPVKLNSNSTTGLLFMNKRTGEAMELNLPGVSLESAERTAVGSIQEKGYEPTTPTLQNIGGYPTYVMSLKDASGVVRGLAYVNYQDYTKSAVGDTVKLAEKAYLNVMGNQTSLVPDDVETFTGIIQEIQQVYLDGNSVFLFKINDNNTIFQASILLDYDLAFLKVGTNVEFKASLGKVSDISINETHDQ